MYRQRRYGEPNERRQNNSRDFRGGQNSRYKRDNRRGNNSGPNRTTTTKPVVEVKAEEPAAAQEEQAPSNNTVASTEAAVEGYTYEETYVEADVVGFDETATQEQATGEQQTVIDLEQPSTQGEAGSREQYSFETPKQKMQERPHSGTNRRQRDNQRDNQRSSQRDAQREAQRDTQRDAQRDAQRDTQRDQNNGREQRDLREPNKDESNSLQANEFGVYSLGEKRLVDLSSLVLQHEKRFSGRARLFVANLATVVTEDDLKTLFGKFGETNEVYVNKDKGFGFVRLDYKINAEIARNALDGYSYKGRFLKVKFAAHQSAIEIHGLDRFSSNESLELAFAQFGVVERATVICDERGKSKGYAVVEFAYKKSAQTALQKINDGLFVLGRLPKPIFAKQLTQTDGDGIHEKDLERVPGIMKDREYKARFILPETDEYAIAKRWKELEEHGRTQKDALDRQLEEDREKLEIEIETAMHDQEADFIRQELLQKQAALEEEIRRIDEMRSRESMMIREGHHSFMQDMRDRNRPQSESARMQDDFIRQQQQELRRRQGTDDAMRAAGMGMGGLSPAAALAMAASGNPAASAAAANILQAMKGPDVGPGMSRMPGPHGMGPIGMGTGGMPQRPMFDGRQGGQGRGNVRPGMRRPNNRDSPQSSNNNKRPRK